MPWIPYLNPEPVSRHYDWRLCICLVTDEINATTGPGDWLSWLTLPWVFLVSPGKRQYSTMRQVIYYNIPATSSLSAGVAWLISKRYHQLPLKLFRYQCTCVLSRANCEIVVIVVCVDMVRCIFNNVLLRMNRVWSVIPPESTGENFVVNFRESRALRWFKSDPELWLQDINESSQLSGIRL